jgi:hypothetical protein
MLKFFVRIRDHFDPGSGMEKEPGSEINIPDPQHIKKARNCRIRLGSRPDATILSNVREIFMTYGFTKKIGVT